MRRSDQTDALAILSCRVFAPSATKPPAAPVEDVRDPEPLTPDDAPIGLRRSIVADQYFWLRAKALEGEAPVLTRLAVGDHLLLGGDNVDVTLARKAEAHLGARLDAVQWSLLVQACRTAKERLLGAVSAVLNGVRIHNTWRGTGVVLYRNWLDHLGARRRPGG